MPRPADRRGGEDGYALVAAVTAVAVFAYVALQVLAAQRGALAVVSAEVERAKLASAAEAGVALAIHGLAAEDRGSRWSLDGRPRQIAFGGVDLTITVEDERGKAPLSGLTNPQARALFSAGGAAGEQLDHLVAEFRDWQNDPAAGADLGDLALPAPDGRPVRHGPFRTVGELAALQDMTPAIYQRVSPAVTVFFEDTGGFANDHASALAKAVMQADTGEADADVGDVPAADDQQAQEELADAASLVGDPVTITVVARDRSGAQSHRTEIVELTGDAASPYWVRYAQ